MCLRPAGIRGTENFELRNHVGKTLTFDVTDDTAEDVIWRTSVQPLLADLNENVLDICDYGFTEMANNVISHSGSEVLIVSIERTAVEIKLYVYDKGIGIFKKNTKRFQFARPLGIHCSNSARASSHPISPAIAVKEFFLRLKCSMNSVFGQEIYFMRNAFNLTAGG